MRVGGLGVGNFGGEGRRRKENDGRERVEGGRGLKGVLGNMENLFAKKGCYKKKHAKFIHNIE